MSIFDSMRPEQIARLLSTDNGGLDLTIAGQTSAPTLWDLPSSQELMMDKKKKEIEKPVLKSGMKDVSGFANYGMTPPQLPVGQGMLAMPGVQDASRPSQAGAPVMNQGIPQIQNMPGPRSSNPRGPGLMSMPNRNPAMQSTPGRSEPNPIPDSMKQIMSLIKMLGG